MNEAQDAIDEFMSEKDKPKYSSRDWHGLAQGDAINFMTQHNLDKLTIEDGSGNKAVLKRLKDNGIKVDVTSTSIF